MTGAGSLSPCPQPVTEIWSNLSLSIARTEYHRNPDELLAPMDGIPPH